MTIMNDFKKKMKSAASYIQDVVKEVTTSHKESDTSVTGSQKDSPDTQELPKVKEFEQRNEEENNKFTNVATSPIKTSATLRDEILAEDTDSDESSSTSSEEEDKLRADIREKMKEHLGKCDLTKEGISGDEISHLEDTAVTSHDPKYQYGIGKAIEEYKNLRTDGQHSDSDLSGLISFLMRLDNFLEELVDENHYPRKTKDSDYKYAISEAAYALEGDQQKLLVGLCYETDSDIE